MTLSRAHSKLIGFSLPENPISPLAWMMKSTIAERLIGDIGDFCVDEAIGKANTLIEAMGWIRRFRGKTTVIKLGGSLLDDEAALMHILWM